MSFAGDCCGDVNTFSFASSLFNGGTIAITGGDYFGTPVNASGFVSSAGVPEPEAWAVMVLGFGALGGAMRLRKRREDAALAF